MRSHEEKGPIRFIEAVVRGGTCTGCGACVGIEETGRSRMVDTPWGPRPDLHPDAVLPDMIFSACPGMGIHYPRLYSAHYGGFPENWLTGIISSVHTGFSGVPEIRRNGASGGVLTQVLIHLLESGKINAAIVVKQGIPLPEKARVILARSAPEIREAAQSVYIPVSTLDILQQLQPGETYAITCLPDQSAALRVLQVAGHPGAKQIRYILGPYTGTALYPAAIDNYLRSHRVRRDDPVVSLQWRAGEWPGYLEIRTASGRILRSKKIYYNFLTPFFITNASLQQMDFTNEFADLAVGDAWSPAFEAMGQGFSVVVSRTSRMDELLAEMRQHDLIRLTPEQTETASAMHLHMIDFKKRGGYLRNRMRRLTGRAAPDFGYRPAAIPVSRTLVELVISTIFLLGRTGAARLLLRIFPEQLLGRFFNFVRLKWKRISKSTKRKSLGNYRVIIT